MSEIVNPHEQLKMAAYAAGYLGKYDESEGAYEWLYPYCDGDEWNPRESYQDSCYLVLACGLQVEVDRNAMTVTAVIDDQYPVEHIVMVERFADHESEMDAYLMAITRAAAEIGRCTWKEPV